MGNSNGKEKSIDIESYINIIVDFLHNNSTNRPDIIDESDNNIELKGELFNKEIAKLFLNKAMLFNYLENSILEFLKDRKNELHQDILEHLEINSLKDFVLTEEFIFTRLYKYVHEHDIQSNLIYEYFCKHFNEKINDSLNELFIEAQIHSKNTITMEEEDIIPLKIETVKKQIYKSSFKNLQKRLEIGKGNSNTKQNRIRDAFIRNYYKLFCKQIKILKNSKDDHKDKQIEELLKDLIAFNIKYETKTVTREVFAQYLNKKYPELGLSESRIEDIVKNK